MFRRKTKPALAPQLACLTEGELAAKGWPKTGLSTATRAKLLGLSVASSFADLPDAHERERQLERSAPTNSEE